MTQDIKDQELAHADGHLIKADIPFQGTLAGVAKRQYVDDGRKKHFSFPLA